MREKSKYCQHCLPTKHKNHILEYIEFFVNKITTSFTKLSLLFLSQCQFQKISQQFSVFLIKFFNVFGFAKFDYNPIESEIRNRVLIFFKQGQELGLNLCAVKIFGNYNGEFRLKYKNKTYFYPGIPIKIKDFQSFERKIDNKAKFKQFLNNQDFPIPAGGTCYTYKTAKKIADSIGFPVVVKPASGSLSVHTSLNINSYRELKQAVKIAKQYKPEVMVEEFIPGDLFRATVVGKEKIFICKKETANVTGDGKSTIRELIKEKNSDPKRGETDQKNTTLHKIPFNELLKQNLQQQNLTLDYIPDKKEKIYLHNKVILSQGCDIITKTNSANQATKEMLIDLARKLKTELVGFDFICEDVTQSPSAQKFAIIEANSFPYLDMHQFPSHGKAEDVAKEVWKLTLEKIGQ